MAGCRAGTKPQGGQLLPQHNASDYGGHSMEPIDSRGIFIYGLFGQVAVMGRKGWPAMVFLLHDLLHCFLPDLFFAAAAADILRQVYPSPPLRLIQPKLCAMALLFDQRGGNRISRRVGCGMDSILDHKEKPSALVALPGPVDANIPVFHAVDQTDLD